MRIVRDPRRSTVGDPDQGTRTAAHVSSKAANSAGDRAAVASSATALWLQSSELERGQGRFTVMECRRDLDCDPSGEITCDQGYCL